MTLTNKFKTVVAGEMDCHKPFKIQPDKIVKHTQTIRRGWRLKG